MLIWKDLEDNIVCTFFYTWLFLICYTIIYVKKKRCYKYICICVKILWKDITDKCKRDHDL